MESHAQSADSILLDGLSFKLPATADYVTNRRSCTLCLKAVMSIVLLV